MPTLITIPPELLLSIISHLPSSTSFYALSQTSHSLASFLNTHAATICNTHIQKHYSRAAAILESEHIDGWLVPKHACITQAEDRWLSERNSTAATSPRPRQALNLNNCCFRTESVTSSDNIPPRPSRLSIKKQQTNETISPPTSPTSIIHRPLLSSHTTHHPDPSMSLALGLPLKLSRPGPHYLSFLERYSGEIVARWVMDMSNPGLPKDNDQLYHFTFMISTYCVRKWLLMCDVAFEPGLPYTSPIEKTSKSSATKKQLITLIERSKAGLRSLKQGLLNTNKKKPPPQRMLFGEISESEDEKSSLGIEKEFWMKGLLWYYGYSAQLAVDDGNHVSINTSIPRQRRRIKGTRFRIFTTAVKEGIKENARRVEPKFRKAWKVMLCRSKFEILGD